MANDLGRMAYPAPPQYELRSPHLLINHLKKKKKKKKIKKFFLKKIKKKIKIIKNKIILIK